MIRYKKYSIPILLSAMILLVSLFLVKIYQKNYNSNITDVSSSNLTFFLEDEIDSGTYTKYGSLSWPSDEYEFNREKSYCSNGSLIGFDSFKKETIVSFSSADECYAYFDKVVEKTIYANEYLASLQETVDEKGYRYENLNANNYLCFGTTDLSTCLNDTNQYLYRIIGVLPTEYTKVGNKVDSYDMLIKIIKNTPFNFEDNNNDMIKNLNYGEYYLGLNELQQSMIVSANFNAKQLNKDNYLQNNVDSIYNLEPLKDNIINKIGLISLSDIMYASNVSECPRDVTLEAYSKCYSNNWLHSNLLTIDKVSENGNLSITSEGAPSLESDYTNIQPVMYLKPEIRVLSGDGNINNPYIFTN